MSGVPLPSVLAGFLDLVQLADHPGDALTYRHFRLTPIAAAKYPDGIPPAKALSVEMADAFAEDGLAETFRKIRALLPEDPRDAWGPEAEAGFDKMIRAAEEFERTPAADTHLSDFPRFLSRPSGGLCLP